MLAGILGQEAAGIIWAPVLTSPENESGINLHN